MVFQLEREFFLNIPILLDFLVHLISTSVKVKAGFLPKGRPISRASPSIMDFWLCRSPVLWSRDSSGSSSLPGPLS
ncbi:hypothetical protein BACCAP_04709 [Pseudoflavonifractor capillosus ATCC 29799]|uniref:Uncharacterized protein n=1 Tax=Pseudoflavonifractor capillosus ATCC 29799 TaxID=411467 RepID=A6P2H8_9FIRM|nr:hypothetical protein BACCAP_04709 [Pseudoflavonifractor capillosus ATCC 29799]